MWIMSEAAANCHYLKASFGNFRVHATSNCVQVAWLLKSPKDIFSQEQLTTADVICVKHALHMCATEFQLLVHNFELEFIILISS